MRGYYYSRGLKAEIYVSVVMKYAEVISSTTNHRYRIAGNFRGVIFSWFSW